MDPKTLPVNERVRLLVESLDGAEATNEALSNCEDGESMMDVLLGASSKLGLGLTKEDFLKTPPIRDWIWWKNKDAPLTLGDGVLRYQQDKTSQGRRFIGMGALIILLFIVGIICGF